MPVTPAERDFIRIEVINELRLALASHAYRCDPTDPAQRCIICGAQQRHETHLRYGVTTADILRDLIGDDIPARITRDVDGSLHLTIEPERVAAELAFAAGRIDYLGAILSTVEAA